MACTDLCKVATNKGETLRKGRLAGWVPVTDEPTKIGAKPMFFEPEQIIEMFDQNPDLTLSRLAEITGWSDKELKTLLMGA